MFSFEEVQLQFQIQSQIRKLLVKGNVFYLVLINGLVYRIYLDNPEKVDKIQIDSNNVTVANAYLDPFGYHLIVQTTKREYFYLSLHSLQFRNLSKLKGSLICSMVYFDSNVTSKSTGPVLVATTTGNIYELLIESNREKYFKQLWKGKDTIGSLYAEKGEKDETFVVASLANTKLARFHGALGTSLMKKDPLLLSFGTISAFSANETVFAFIEVSEDNVTKLVIGEIGFQTRNDLKRYEIENRQYKSLLVTKYHVVAFTSTEMIVFNQLNGKLVHHETLSFEVTDSTSDYRLETFWVYSNSNVYELVVDNEHSDVWKIMIEKKLYDDALAVVSDDPLKRDVVLINKGNDLLQKGEMDEAARILANTSESFEQVVLKFIKSPSLLVYLHAKLESLPKSMYMQRVMLSSWIVELYVKNPANDNSQELYAFFEKYKDSLDKETVYQLLLSHNRTEELVHFSSLINDNPFLLKYYLNLQQWDKALEILAKEESPQLVYKCSTALLIHYPIKTVDLWQRLIDDLDFRKLLPAILTYNKAIGTGQGIAPDHNQAIRFLNFLVKEKESKEKMVHNTLLSLLVTYPVQRENHVLKYLESRSKTLFNREKSYEILFDTDFILRLCFKHKRIQSAIFIYSMLEEYEDALSLALSQDLLESALLVADKPKEPVERKKLWVRVAEVLIKKVVTNEPLELDIGEGNKIRGVLKYLMEKCDLLTMKDLLPLFPDFVVIDDFKEEVVQSLETLAVEMDSLSLEMTASLNQSEKINKQIKEFQQDQFQIIEPNESCGLCGKILVIRKFIVFPCLHSFHQDCLVREVLDSTDYKFKNAIYKIQKRLQAARGNKQLMEELRLEIDRLLSAKCCLCSDIKINSIEEPLIKSNDKEQNEWAL
ncbi:hypothetical protein OGAPHI_006741 [Ogataea philodendri]|uniref:Pep3/Vps18/deep orange domain-containing protein n=1 Tax=Ogataea philodendri TaxID=1378263 RepID=A0A9P8NYE2_9ASCO|nr:uncharacterized protein OGAPHI_006741 [Ogataea philodendri]KAH3661334.1 hypothetical protein OGAPHI_006741 [Ogataea philodendri]